jgi:predicted RNase H-like HicB family nuclease
VAARWLSSYGESREMTVPLTAIMEALSPEERQRVKDRAEEVIKADPRLRDLELLLNDRRSRLRYGLLIQWSQVEEAFVVHLPEFPDPKFATQGATYEEAFQNGLNYLDQLIQSYLIEGRELPLVLNADRLVPAA